MYLRYFLIIFNYVKSLLSFVDGETSWRRTLSPGGGSRTSSPCSLDEKSLLNLSDSPLSPTAAEIPLEQLPFAVGVNEGHPYACQFCEKAFPRLSFLKKHEQVGNLPFTVPEVLISISIKDKVV